ncbi:DnaB-like helicase C-terminal domain-containing protein [Sabulibacter ruber]|uniref:DnaB-like helicase C-terminal domain-containing protein n=1 Tax=Sabulibacter ruber TaxID=2811901 RepID=UPI001A96742C|nr:DnaB-like helicase C-terminal domain-containing protein [Sabulibacter ruber]
MTENSGFQKEIERLEATTGEAVLNGLPSGFPELDVITNGFQKGNLYVLAGQPSMGNTALTMSIARALAVEYGKPLAYLSAELSESEIIKRLISGECSIDLDKIIKNNLMPYEVAQVRHSTRKIQESPLLINDYSKLWLNVLLKDCRALVESRRAELVIIDDIQRVSLNEEQRRFVGNREQEVSYIVRELKALAKELEIPIIANSQINRAVENRYYDKRPKLNDLRDSGSIENEADIVAFLYRPEYYGGTEYENNYPKPYNAELIVAKHRNGRLGTVPLQFIAKFTKFTAANNEPEVAFDSIPDIDELTGFPVTIRLGNKMNSDFKDGLPHSSWDDAPPF